MREKQQCNIIYLDKHQKEKSEKMQDYKQTLLIVATGDITKNLTRLIDNSNIDYAIGHLLQEAEYIGKLYSVPGYASQRIGEDSGLAAKRLALADVIKKRVKSAYGE